MNDHHGFVARFHAQAQLRARIEAEAQTRIAVNLVRDAIEKALAKQEN